MDDPRRDGTVKQEILDSSMITMDEVEAPKDSGALDKEMIGVELATGRNTLIVDALGIGHNPDTLVEKKGLSVFDTMKLDATVKATLFVKKFTRLSTQWFVKPASESAQDVAIAEFYDQQLTQIPGTVIKFLLGQMTCLDYGYSILEENYYYIEEGESKGKIGLSSIKSKKPHDITFNLDKFNNIENLVQKQDGKDVELPTNKFIVTSWMPEWENPYGTSDLKAAYIPWWQKDVIMRFQAIWLERYPSPFLLGTYPPGTDEETKDELLTILEDLQIHTEAIKPEGVEIETVTMDRTGSDIYTKAIDKRDSMIARALLVPELLGFTDKGSTGSYALGKKQFDLFIGILWHLGRTLEETIHEQLTVPLVTWNFPVKTFPEFTFYPLTEESNEMKAKIAATLASAGFIDPADEDVRAWIGDYLNILPLTATKASEMAQEAMTYEEPFKFYSPDGQDMIEVEVLETAARIELLNDALQKTG